MQASASFKIQDLGLAVAILGGKTGFEYGLGFRV